MPHGRGGSWIHPHTRWAVYYRDRFRCVHCGARVKGGTSPMAMKSDYPRKGWAPGSKGWIEDAQVATIDHTFPGCKPAECVTACWPCNSSAGNRVRSIRAAPLTEAHRAKGRALYKSYILQRNKAREESRRLAQENGDVVAW